MTNRQASKPTANDEIMLLDDPILIGQGSDDSDDEETGLKPTTKVLPF